MLCFFLGSFLSACLDCVLWSHGATVCVETQHRGKYPQRGALASYGSSPAASTLILALSIAITDDDSCHVSLTSSHTHDSLIVWHSPQQRSCICYRESFSYSMAFLYCQHPLRLVLSSLEGSVSRRKKLGGKFPMIFNPK